jgi:hypothetical protein
MLRPRCRWHDICSLSDAGSQARAIPARNGLCEAERRTAVQVHEMLIQLLGIPTDVNSSYRRGSAAGPAAIRRAWRRYEEFGNAATESGLEFGTELQLEDLGDDFRCIAWDLPGYGDSEPIVPLTFTAIADAALSPVENIRKTAPERIRELYLRSLGRAPSESEQAIALEYLMQRADRLKEAYEDLVWGIVNSKEFLFNH